jgi:hypothetical protein
MTKIAGSGSRIQDPDPEPDPLVRGMDPRIRIRIHPKISWIRNTGFNLSLHDRHGQDMAYLKTCEDFL